MKAVDKNTLLDSLAEHGFELMKPASTLSPEEMLHALLKQDDARLLEGFPVVFTHLLKDRESFRWEDPKWLPGHELSEQPRRRLADLLVLTYRLYEMFAMNEKLKDRTLKLLSKVDDRKKMLEKYKNFFMTDAFNVDGLELSFDRLVNNFRMYVTLHPVEREAVRKVHEMELELLLSQLFTVRQKELVRKRLGNKTLTKTEKEYFYRVVKKRLQALANDELHQLAKELV